MDFNYLLIEDITLLPVCASNQASRVGETFLFIQNAIRFLTSKFLTTVSFLISILY